jgi:tripartite-type tricarboxylate transporter receptor subunit TctC
VASLALGTTWLAAPGSIRAQDAWPIKPVKMIIPFPPGQATDIFGRLFAQRLSSLWGQGVVVDNRPGANTLVGTELVARASDGHTLLLTTDATFTINPHLYTRLPYDFERDFAPVSRMVSFSQLFVATAALPASTLPELIAMARKQPGQLSYASYGAGSQPQLATEMLKQKAGVFIVHIPYRGIPQAVSAVVRLPSTMAESALPKPVSTDRRGVRPSRSSSRMRS